MQTCHIISLFFFFPHHLFCACLWLSFLMLVDLKFLTFQKCCCNDNTSNYEVNFKSYIFRCSSSSSAILQSLRTEKSAECFQCNKAKTVCTAKNKPLSKDNFNWNWDLTKLLELGSCINALQSMILIHWLINPSWIPYKVLLSRYQKDLLPHWTDQRFSNDANSSFILPSWVWQAD